VIEVRIPPLRQRREDISLLVDHFLKRQSKELGRPITVSAAARKLLEDYDFPGNVRELENVIERAVALAPADEIDVDDLPRLRTTAVRSAVEAGGAVELPAEGVDLDRLVADYERAWVARALEKAGGVRKKAAHLLGISFRSMRYRLAKLGFDKDATALDKDDDEPA
jgi:two-component system response regulator PilR (NtrC family)